MPPSKLPAALSEALSSASLLDPTTLSASDAEATAGTAGFGALAIFLLPLFQVGVLPDAVLSALVGGGLGGYVALRDDPIGNFARDVVGVRSSKAAGRARDLAGELVEKVKQSL